MNVDELHSYPCRGRYPGSQVQPLTRQCPLVHFHSSGNLNKPYKATTRFSSITTAARPPKKS